MDTNYINLLNYVEDINNQRQKQKNQGLNDYSLASVLRKPRDEVGMHSLIIYSLLNPKGIHYQNDLFLNLFIEKVIGIPVVDFGENIEVFREELTDTNRRIDFTIKSSKYLIGIEMKVNAPDLNNQIADYYTFLKKESENGDGTPRKIQILYLSKFGKVAPNHSRGNIPSQNLKNISFNKHILEWLNACLNSVWNITNLNIYLKDYISVVQKITRLYKSNIMDINEELALPGNKDHLLSLLSIDPNKTKGILLHNFFDQITKSLIQDKYLDISNHFHENVESRDKCIKWYADRKPKNYSKGRFFDCSLGNDQYFHVQVATDYFHFGIVKTDGSFKLINADENNNFKPAYFRKNWAPYMLNWHSVAYKNVRKINGDVLNMLHNFENSDLHKKMKALIKQVQPSATAP